MNERSFVHHARHYHRVIPEPFLVRFPRCSVVYIVEDRLRKLTTDRQTQTATYAREREPAQSPAPFGFATIETEILLDTLGFSTIETEILLDTLGFATIETEILLDI